MWWVVSKQTSSSGVRLFPGGILQIRSNGDDQMVAKFWQRNFKAMWKIRRQNQKKSHAEFPSLKKIAESIKNKIKWYNTENKNIRKNHHQNYVTRICRHYHESSAFFKRKPKQSVLKSSHPKKARNEKFQTQKVLQSSLSLEIQSTPAGVLFEKPWFTVGTFFQNFILLIWV